MSIFPFTKNIGAYDKDLTPIIVEGIHEYILEVAKVTYPEVPPDVILKHYNQTSKLHYEALALKISERIQKYAKTSTTNPSRGTT